MLDLSNIVVEATGPDWEPTLADAWYAQAWPHSEAPGPYVFRATPEEALTALLALLGFANPA